MSIPVETVYYFSCFCFSLSDMFDQAQQFVYAEMERHLLHPFLQSEDGCNYLQMLVKRDLTMMTKISL